MPHTFSDLRFLIHFPNLPPSNNFFVLDTSEYKHKMCKDIVVTVIYLRTEKVNVCFYLYERILGLITSELNRVNASKISKT